MNYSKTEQDAIDEAVRRMIDSERPYQMCWWRLVLSFAIAAALGVLYLDNPRVEGAIAGPIASFAAACALRPWRQR